VIPHLLAVEADDYEHAVEAALAFGTSKLAELGARSCFVATDYGYRWIDGSTSKLFADDPKGFEDWCRVEVRRLLTDLQAEAELVPSSFLTEFSLDEDCDEAFQSLFFIANSALHYTRMSFFYDTITGRHSTKALVERCQVAPQRQWVVSVEYAYL
jgi:hypothetical protein